MRAVGSVPVAVAVAAVKRAVHIIEGVPDDDLLIGELLGAAQDTVETATRRPMIARDVVITFRACGGRRWWCPCAPVAAVDGVAVQQADGSFAAVAAEDWRLERGADEPSLVFSEGLDWLASGGVVEVTCSVGYAEGAAPRQLAQAVVLLAKEWMDAGITVEPGQAVPQMGFGVRALMRQVRYARPAEFAAA